MLNSSFVRRIRAQFSGDPASQGDVAYYLTSGFWLNANSAVTLLLSFGISIAYANFLPKEVYGTYQYLLSLFSILGAFTLSGMNSAITRSVARGYEGALRSSILPQLRWNLISTGIALCFTAYYFLHAEQTLSLGMAFIAIALPIITTFNSYGAFLIGKKAFRTFFAYSSAVSIAYYA
ncbi:MAG TPA: oligosaccharide flippase family protein, partial [Candidatus Paceibacterota bacterium]|nr:oligosaccharide flippase family protein [Candidatus Paceibacterota bacterium]